MKAIVVYWTATGNTEAIANKIASDTNATVKNVGEVSVEEVLGYDTIILGCPAMGSEELEDGEFKPFYDELIQKVENRRIFLFGSYGWGDGEWMRNWCEDVKSNGANLAADGLIANGDDSALDQSEYDNFISKINN
jgi:flavodoxin short chain